MNREICFSPNADVTQSSSGAHQGGSGVPPLKQNTDPMSAKLNAQISSETPLPPSKQSSTWQRQLLTVDFRHAFWPWVVYLIGLLLLESLWLNPDSVKSSSDDRFIILLAIVGFSAPTVAVRIFCTDFGFNTAERLLACPIPRFSIWYLRLLLTAGILFIPALGFYSLPGLMPIKLSSVKAGVFATAMLVLLITWCAWCFAPLWSLLLRRPILAYPAVVLAPFYILFVAATIDHLELWDMFVIALALGLAAQFLAAYLWRRLEVRQ